MTQTATAPTATDYYVTAEAAPLGVQLWPTRGPEFADNFTLGSVSILRTETTEANYSAGAVVVWTYRSGKVRTFRMGEQVACRTI